MSDLPSGFCGLALGHHLTAEFYDCASDILADAGRMEKIFVHAAAVSGAHVLGSHFHAFEPQGVSGFVIIAESHFSVHAWPEHDYAAVDIFTCGEHIDFSLALDCLKKEMASGSVVVSSMMSRGIVGNNGVERMVPVYAGKTNVYALAWRTQFDAMHAWGLLDSIDLHECDVSLLGDAARISVALENFCRDLGLADAGAVSPVVAPFETEGKGDGFNFCVMLGNASQVSGNLSHSSGCVYLNVFATKFFEPRTAAEMALKAFHGRRYRMQVAVRR